MLRRFISRWRYMWRLVAFVYALLFVCAIGLALLHSTSAPARLAAALVAPPVIPTRYGRLHTSVRNVFGDPVTMAVLTIDEQQTTSDDQGIVMLDAVSVGWHVLDVKAPGYHPLSRRVRIEEGANEPLIQYEDGLWPATFAADFHAFYAKEDAAEQRLFVQIGLANGWDLPVYIYDLYTTDDRGERLDTLLATPAGYERLALMYPHISLATEPLALVLKPKGLVILELPPFHTTPRSTTSYTLTIQYGVHDERRAGPTETMQVHRQAAWEADLNPHRP